jgi:hypothetical protein
MLTYSTIKRNSGSSGLFNFKIKRLYEIRWLAWYDAIKNICNSIPALLRIFKDAKNDGEHELYIKLTS